MSDRFYDRKGIEHLTKENADYANRRYLSEEEEAREKGLKLQRQQLEVVERAAREVEGQRREQAEAEREKLAALKLQGRVAQRDRDYEKRILFLKESDESTRLDTFLEMLLNQVGLKEGNEDTFYAMLLSQLALKDYTKGRPVEVDDEFGQSMTEHHKAVALLFKLPSVPEECRENGTLTNKIRALVASEPKVPQSSLPEKALRLKSEHEKIQKEIKELEQKQAGGVTKWLGLVAYALVLFGVAGIVEVVRDATSQHRQPMLIMAFIMIGLGGVLGVPIYLIHAPKANAKKKEIGTLTQRRTALEKELETFSKQHSEAESAAKTKAQKEHNDAVRDCVEQWMSAFRNAFLKSFFDQRLWIEDEFSNRLRAALKEIQKSFPTSCRADANNLQAEQIERAYKTLTEAIAANGG